MKKKYLAKPRMNNSRFDKTFKTKDEAVTYLENETGHQMAFEKVDGVRIYDWEIIGKLLEV